MRKTFVSTATAFLSLSALFFLVQFLGAPVKSETVQAGLKHRPLSASLSGSVSGVVVDRRGDPLNDISVIASTPERIEEFRTRQLEGPEHVLSETRCDDQGHFVLEGLSAGDVRVWAGGERWLFAMTHVIEVRAGHEAHGLQIRLEPRADKTRADKTGQSEQ